MELQNLFSTVCNMTITGSVVIGCVLLARLALRKAPRLFSYALWAVVLFRLLCPVSVSGPVSVLSVVDAPEPKASVGAVEYVAPPISAPVETIHVEASHSQEPAPSAPSPVEPSIDWERIAAWVWAAGACALAIYGVVSYVNLKRKLRESVPIGTGIREADGIRSPFVLGLLRPVIYLPSDLREEEGGYILLHEQFHVRHGDHIVKALFWVAVCLHWFNPLVWVAFVLCGRDMEMRCDEAVLKKLGPQVRSDYAQSLLDLAAGRRLVPAPLAFGEGDTGKRVKHVLNWKRKKLWMAVPAAVLCAVVLVLTACNPGGSLFGDTPFGHSYRAEWIESPVADASVSADTLYTLSSDQLLLVREGGNTQIRGTFVKAAVSDVPDAFRSADLRRAWKTDGDDWWLTEQKDGTLYLIWGEMAYHLERTDLLGVSIKQPGIESYVEPVWYQPDSPDWYSGSLSTTLVDSEAEIVLISEIDADRILVSEEYYERLADGETSVTNSDYSLEPDENGDFILNVSRRGTVGDDFAIYRVTVGEDNYMFRLAFPAVPGVTTFEGYVEENPREVTFSENNAYITLRLPESWEYEITSLTEDDYAAGITFWPRGREEGKLRFEYYPRGFGVCGTGLESRTLILGGREVSAGTYDGDVIWDFIGMGERFAVWGENQKSWWAEYGDTAMEILDTAQFGEYVDMDAVRGFFRSYHQEELGPGQPLWGEADYQAVYYEDASELRLCEYTAAGTEVEVINEWSGQVLPGSAVSMNVLECEGKYIYFGLFDVWNLDLTGGSFHLLLENGWTIDVTLDWMDGFCFVCDYPMEDFRLVDGKGTLIQDLKGYLDKGYEVAEAEGKIVLKMEGEIACMFPISPTEP